MPNIYRPDPLQLLSATRTSFRQLTPSPSDVVQNALSAQADVPPRIQSGPTCGLYALGMVLDYWDLHDRANLNPLVSTDDLYRPGSYTRPPDTEARLFDTAVAAGFTTQGEMFYADQLAELARKFGYHARVRENFTLEDVHACLRKKHPVLIAFDVDSDGNPAKLGGKRAHWAVIEAKLRVGNEERLIATHAWKGADYEWRASDLIASSYQLRSSNFPGAPKDISKTLAARIVEVYPRSETSALPWNKQ